MKTVTYEPAFKCVDGEVLQVNASKDRGCYIEILHKTYEQLTNMLSHHRKVLVVIMIYHLHTPTQDNLLFSKFIHKLRKRYCKRYSAKRLGYLWVREQGQREAQHYHLAIFLDGSTIQTPHRVFELCVNIWEGWNQPRPAFSPGRSYYQLKRGDTHKFAEAFHHLSYFAKTRSKGLRPSATNDYSTSRIANKAH